MPQHIRALAVLTVSLPVIAACGTTRHFVDQPPLSIAEAGQDAHQAAASLFDSAPPYTVRLCEADPASRACRQGSDGITARGVGGLFLPLALHVSALTVSQQGRMADGWMIEASVQSKVDAIAPLCVTAHGQILSRDNNTISVQLRNFYCNWSLIGNVIVNAELSIDSISLKDKVFTGFYKVIFHGTGNAAGSGYYRAEILSSSRPSQAHTDKAAPPPG